MELQEKYKEVRFFIFPKPFSHGLALALPSMMMIRRRKSRKMKRMTERRKESRMKRRYKAITKT